MKKHFEPLTRLDKGNDQHRIIVLNGHSTHIKNFKFVKFALDHNIHLLDFPSHATHILQPLDVGIFGPLAKYYSLEVIDLNTYGGLDTNIQRGDFFKMFWKARKNTMGETNIKIGMGSI
jgi:hypothetical protein